MNSVKDFLTNYQKPILIAVVVAVVLFFAYRWFGGGHETYGYGQMGGYPQGYVRHPGMEGFYADETSEQTSEPENFYGETTPTSEDQQQGGHGQPKILMLYFAPWCSHCKKLIENDGAWTQLERKYASHPYIKIHKVDCDKHPEMATKANVTGFPTIKLLHGNQTMDYDGDRSLGSLEKFLE